MAHTLNTLHDLFIHEIQDLYNAETQLTQTLPKMIEMASSSKLKKGFEKHLKQTEKQVERLQQVVKELNIEAKGTICKGMEGLVKEGAEVMKMKGNPEVFDMALVSIAQRVEHYEIAGYSAAIMMAKTMKHTKVAKLLKETLDEEKETDKILKDLVTTDLKKKVPLHGD